jgi:(S)-sulfolactate dehydrogenase
MMHPGDDALSTLPITGEWVSTLSNPNPTDPGYMDTESDGEGGVRSVLIAEPLDPAIVDALSRRCHVRYDPALSTDREALIKAIGRAHALLVGPRVKLDADLLRAARMLRFVGHTALQQDPYAAVLCEQQGITLISAPGAHAQAVAEYVIGMALTLRRGVAQRTPQVAAGLWPQAALAAGREIFGATLGIVGFGVIGQTVSKLAQGLGMRVVAYDPAIAMDEPMWQRRAVRPMFLDELLRQADVVSLHVPLAPETRGMIDAAALMSMKRGAVLINTAQGGLVDEEALALALQGGQLGGAALDVFAHEPLKAGSALASCPNLILTPHVAGLTLESTQRAARMVAERIALALGVT